MKIAIGNDHAAVELKKTIMEYVESLGHEVTNFGTDTNESCDYPVYGEKVANAVASGEYVCGILICGTGVGISISANKVPGIRCALWLRNRDEAADHHDRESLLQVQPELDVHPRNVSCFQQTLHSLQL